MNSELEAIGAEVSALNSQFMSLHREQEKRRKALKLERDYQVVRWERSEHDDSSKLAFRQELQNWNAAYDLVVTWLDDYLVRAKRRNERLRSTSDKSVDEQIAALMEIRDSGRAFLASEGPRLISFVDRMEESTRQLNALGAQDEKSRSFRLRKRKH